MESGIPIPPEVGLALAGIIGIAAIGTTILMAGSSPETEAAFSTMAWEEAAVLVSGAILGWIAGLRRP